MTEESRAPASPSSAAGPARGVHVVEADLERDRATIIELWNRHLPGGVPFPERRYDWEFARNPAGPAQSFLLVSDSDGRVVGTTTLVPRVLQTPGGAERAGRATLMVIDREYRLLGPALMLQRRVLQAADAAGMALVFTVVPAHALPVFKRLGFVSGGTYLRHAHPIDLRPHVARLLRSPAAARACGAPLNLAWRAVSRETWRRPGGFDVVEGLPFDERFDELWQRVGPTAGVTTARSSAFLRWRFDDCPWAQTFVTLAVLDRAAGRLAGYAVCFVRDGQAHVFDALCEPGVTAFDALMGAILRWARRQGAATVSSLHVTGALSASMRRFGLRPRQDDEQPTTLMVSPRRAALAVAEGWHLLPADNF